MTSFLPGPGSFFACWIRSFVLLLPLIGVGGGRVVAAERLSLGGEWRLALGRTEPVFPQGSLPTLTFDDVIQLPGTTETRGKGPENPAREIAMLTRVRKFEGPTWFQREVDIPQDWIARRIELRLERTKYTQVWIDEQPVGEQSIATAPQIYDVTRFATPGRHRVTVMVDNRPARRPVQAEAHQFSDNTQTNWNGLIGQLELVASPEVRLDDVQIHPDVAAKRLRVRVTPGWLGASAVGGRLMIRAESFNHDGPVHRPPEVRAELPVGQAAVSVKLDIELGEQARLWDEFSPALYRVTVTLEGDGGRDERVIETGLREFKARGTRFTINGRPTFLRGKQDACVFPLTGHPPMDVESWIEYLRICQSYGINHLRCHTWVPPEAAFVAADRLGIYLQPELPFWGTFDEKVRDFLWPEAQATLRAYGNHPSFVMLTLGNEIGGDRGLMNRMVTELRELDPRRLYADGSNNVLWDPRHQVTNDFWPTAKTKTPPSGDQAVAVRGSYYFMDGYDGVVQWGTATTRGDLRAGIEGIPVPVIGHEIGQYTVYPDFKEIARYTGVTRARNLERFRDTLERQGMAEQSDAFLRASGALAASLYREDIELALRTPGFGGFQLLDLQDFPGQGTALVGMLNAFMESKGLITPEAWRRFCSPVVPLARFDRYTWTAAETFAADLELAQFGATDLENAVVSWVITAADGAALSSGAFAPVTLRQGGLREIGRIQTSLTNATAPAAYTLAVTVAAGGESYHNQWPLWIYPPAVTTDVPSGVVVVHAFDDDAKRRLEAGARVVLMPRGSQWGNTVRGGYATDFWCWPMFNSSPGTMGLLCEPDHPALKEFPTRAHSERQWSAIAHASTPVVLVGTPAGYRPLVQVIDNLERNEKLGLVFETKVGAGSLLVVACDLLALEAVPEARQLLSSLLHYAASSAFAPTTALSGAVLERCLRPSLAARREVTASSSFSPPWGFVPTPASAVDGDITTRWQAAEEDRAPSLTVDLGGPRTIDTVELLWEHDRAGYRYLVETSADGAAWDVLSDQQTTTWARGRHTLDVAARGRRYVRLTIVSWPEGVKAALRELRVLGSAASTGSGGNLGG